MKLCIKFFAPEISKRELPKYTDFRIFRQLNRIHLSSCSFVMWGRVGEALVKKAGSRQPAIERFCADRGYRGTFI